MPIIRNTEYENQMINPKTNQRIRRICKILFVIYLFVLAYGLFFNEIRASMAAAGELHYNLVPFLEIRRYLTNTDILGLRNVVMNVFGNMAMFLPFGFLLPTLFPRVRSMGKTILAGLLFSLLIEVLQMTSRLGCFDVDDLIHNTLGVLIGYGINRLAAWRIEKRRL